MCRPSLAARQAEATSAGAAVKEAAGRERSAGTALDQAAAEIARLQTEAEVLKNEEAEGQLRVQVQ